MLSRGYELTPDNIFVGVGSDEAIDILMRIFCKPNKDKIMITPPTYGMYQVSAKVNDIGFIQVPLAPEFDLNITEVRFAYYYAFLNMILCTDVNKSILGIEIIYVLSLEKLLYY